MNKKKYKRIVHIFTAHFRPQVLGQMASNFFFIYTFVQGRWQPTQSQLIQIYSVDWTDVYDTHNIEHRTEPFNH